MVPKDLPSVAACLGKALVIGRRRPWVFLLAFPTLAAILVAGCLLPLFNLPFILLALPSGIGSLFVIGSKLVDHQPLSLSSGLSGFHFFERFLSLFWVGYLMLALSSWPILVALWIDRHFTSEASRLWLLTSAATASVAVAIAILYRYSFAFFVAADLPKELPVQKVLDRSARLFADRPYGLGLRLLGLGIVGLSGTLARGYGLVLTFPIALVALAHLYRELALLGVADRD